MYYVRLLIQAWLLLLVLSTQAKDVDSLRNRLQSANGYELIQTYLALAEYYGKINPDSTLFFGQLAFDEADELDSIHLGMSAQNTIAVAHFRKSDYNRAIALWKDAIDLATEIKDSIKLAAFYNNIGICYNYQGEYATSLEFHQKALGIRELTNDPKISSSLNNIGLVYERLNELDKALEYQLRALELKKKNNQRGALPNSYNNVGIIYKRKGEFDTAIEYYQRSLQIARELNDRSSESFALNNIAILHEESEKYQKAMDYYRESEKIKLDMKDNNGLINTYNSMARTTAYLNRFKEALAYLEKSDSLREESGTGLFEVSSMGTRSTVYELMGNHPLALAAYKEMYALQMERLEEERNERITELEVKYETAKDKAEIQRLELEKEIEIARSQKEKNQLLGILFTSTIVLILLVIVFYLWHKKQKIERLAQEQQFDALQKRYLDLLQSPDSHEMKVGYEDLNQKLFNQLTEREYEVLKMSLEGKTNQEAADALHVSVSTVKFHLGNVYNKLGVQNKKEAIEYVVRTS